MDSHTWLWWLAADSRLGGAAAKILGDADVELYLSAASGWELTVKIAIGKLTLNYALEEILRDQRRRHRVQWLNISPEHCLALTPLPFHHRDPFDRLLIAQAICEKMTILSADVQLDAYGVSRVWS